MSDRYDSVNRSKFGSMFDHEYFIRGRPDLLGKEINVTNEHPGNI